MVAIGMIYRDRALWISRHEKRRIEIRLFNPQWSAITAP